MAEKSKVPEIVSVIGLGKLGSPMAAAVASRGVNVIGVDLDAAKVEAIQRGLPPVNETNLGEYIRRAGKSLSATTDVGQAVTQSEATFLIVPTPSESNGGFSLRHVLPACVAIGRALRAKKEFHIVVITSTVMPGATGGPIRECLEKESGKVAGKDFGLAYSPEFIALGSVIHDFLNPDFILVGESDAKTGGVLDAFYKKVCENEPHIARMNFVNAELSKISVNSYITMKITYANALAHICENLPGADIDVVTGAIGHDSRIGSKYLRGAVGYGGPCFPRDNVALAKVARDAGVQAPLAESTDASNRAEAKRLAEAVSEHYKPGMRVGVLGLSYKPDTEVIEESQGLLLAGQLLERNIDTIVFDPMAIPSAQVVLGDRVSYAGSAADCVRLSDIVIIVTPWKEFAALPASLLDGREKPLIVIDGWRILPPDLRKRVRYFGLGIGSI